MTKAEQRIADFIKKHYDEYEDCLGMDFFRLYAHPGLFNGILKDCEFNGEKIPDVLLLEYVVDHDKKQKYVQVFASLPPDDFLQEWFTFSGLSMRDRRAVSRNFMKYTKLGGFKDRP